MGTYSSECFAQKRKTNNLSFHLKKLEKKEQESKSKVSKRKDIIKIRAEINKIENRKSMK